MLTLTKPKYCATHLPTIYDKVQVNVVAERQAVEKIWVARMLAVFWSIWSLSGVYGVLHTLVRADYLIRRPSERSTSQKVTEQNVGNWERRGIVVVTFRTQKS